MHALHSDCRYSAAMTSITIRHVPDDVRNELAARAARSGRSLQEYMLRELTELARRPSVAEVVERIRENKRSSGVDIERAQILADRDIDRR